MKSPADYLFFSCSISSFMIFFYYVAIHRWVFLSSEIRVFYFWSCLAAISSSVTILYVFQDVPFVFRGFVYCLFALWIYLISLIRPTARHSAIFRVMIVYPAYFAITASFYVIPFAFIYVIFTGARKIVVIPLFAAFFSVLLSIIPPRDDSVHLIADTTTPQPNLARVRTTLYPPENIRPDLVIYQISDIHVGAFTTAQDVAAICQKAVDARPDLILITGDLMSLK